MIAAFAAIQPHLQAVQNAMAEAVASDEPAVRDLIAALGGFHGKMLRPALTVLVAQATGGVNPGHITLGAAIELIHTATLVHDDLIDDAEVRRGQPTAHTRFGNTTAILIGDYLYTHAFHAVSSLGDTAMMQRLTAATNIVCQGELHQQVRARQADVAEAEYERIAYGKTAALTELAGACGGWNRDPALAAAGAAFGRACGLAFQIADDCLDLTGDAEKVGKSLATDLERGRVTLPIIKTLERVPVSERSAAQRLLLDARDDADVSAGRALVLRYDGIGAALERARHHVRSAQSALLALPENTFRTHLHQLAEFIVERDR